MAQRIKQARHIFHCFVLNSHFVQPSECKYVLFFFFVCQTASIFYSLAFKILWPEIFFPHSCSIEGKSNCATHSTTSAGKKSKLLKSAKNNPHVFRQSREIFGDAKISHYTVFSISFFLSDPTSRPSKPCHEKIYPMPTTKEEICLGTCGV